MIFFDTNSRRLIKLSTRVQFKQQLTGDLFADLPVEMSYVQIMKIAQDRKQWKQLSTLVNDPQAIKKHLKFILDLAPNKKPQLLTPESISTLGVPENNHAPPPDPKKAVQAWSKIMNQEKMERPKQKKPKSMPWTINKK